MSTNQFEMVMRLKKKALERCRERVISARAATEGSCHYRETEIPQSGLLKRWKEHRGL